MPPYYIDMTALAEARNVDPGKISYWYWARPNGGEPNQPRYCDILQTNAAEAILTKEDKEAIDMVIVGTESSIDESKSGRSCLTSFNGGFNLSLALSKSRKLVTEQQQAYS